MLAHLIFRVMGILLILYVIQAVVTGKVVVKSGLGSRTVSREESAAYFWISIAIYTGLSVALLVVF